MAILAHHVVAPATPALNTGQELRNPRAPLNRQGDNNRVENVETVVVGAGVIGLAVARALANSGREVIVLDAADAVGTGISSRNSEVIHAGIYYPPGSLKARLCVAGRALLHDYCRSRNVACRSCGKLIVAVNDDDHDVLATLERRAIANGVDDLAVLKAADVASLEPELETCGALLSPSSGIIDSHGLMLALLGEAEAAGAWLALGAAVRSVVADGNSLTLAIDGEETVNLVAREVVNAAGLGAQRLASMTTGLERRHVPALHLARGSYFTLSGPSPFSRLVYPTPVAGGLGVHATLDLAGRCRFGPDVEWVNDISYDVDPARAHAFADAVRRYWPGLPDDALAPDYSGIRPKLGASGEADFRIDGPADHGTGGLVNLFGIESPGLTASLAVARLVVSKLDAWKQR